jgi:hypothetical protein
MNKEIKRFEKFPIFFSDCIDIVYENGDRTTFGAVSVYHVQL